MQEKTTIITLNEKIHRDERISMLALYDAPFAALAQEAGVDSILVGDSVAENVYGDENTLGADMEMMIRHCRAVRPAAPDVFLIGDMPYMSYQSSVESAILNAGRFMSQGRADAVKLEGGWNVVETVRALVRATIPVVGHLGLLPQSVAMMGGYKAQGREAKSAADIVEQAIALQEAGVCMLVLECVPPVVAEAVVRRTTVPVIGIGSGLACHGQVLIMHDLLGLNLRPTARFVRQYARIDQAVLEAFNKYAQEVRQGAYPSEEHCYTMKPGEEEKFLRFLDEGKNRQ